MIGCKDCFFHMLYFLALKKVEACLVNVRFPVDKVVYFEFIAIEDQLKVI